MNSAKALTLPYDLTDPTLAQATWSRLAEPTDKAASVIVAQLGASAALQWLIHSAIDAQGQARECPQLPIQTQADPALAQRAWGKAAARWVPRLRGLDIRKEIDILESLGGSLILPGEAWWPPGCNDLELPPFCLWVRGDPALLVARDQILPTTPAAETAVNVPTPVFPARFREDLLPSGLGQALALAIVGSRACTRYGQQVAYTLAKEVAQCGTVVISGGAYGIDAAAHRGALASGRTISISAGGVDRLYPSGNTQLLEDIIANGALIAEAPPGTPPTRHRFLSRNRLIAAIAHGAIVVEAAWRSGALSTARHARDLGRAVGAVPGLVTSMESAGCHRLLREGAVCVTDSAEAIELIAPLGTNDPDASKHADPHLSGRGMLDGLSPECAAVLDVLPAHGAASVAKLAAEAGLAEKEVVCALGILELSGKASSQAGGWQRLRV